MSEFKEKVDGLVSKMVQGDDGNWALPEEDAKDLDEPTLFAVTSERRVRDTQGAFTKAQQAAKKNEAIAKGFQERLLESDISLTKEQKFELNDLRKTDPEAWRTKLNEYETANRTNLSTELDEIRTKSSNKGELEIRKDQMAAFSEETGVTLTDEVVANDLPPRFLKELEAGKVSFEEFLVKAGNYIKAEKVIQGSDEDTIDDTKDLSDMPGGHEPSEQAQRGDFVETYEKTTF
jgi:hypothetical protein